MAASNFGTTLYDYLKIRFRLDGGRKVPVLPSEQTWKDFKRQWTVLTISLSPMESYLIYCSKEEDWLMNRPSLPKIPMRKFNVIRNEMNAKNKDHLEIEFEQYSIILNFASLTKQQQWYDELERMRCRTYAELVRCPEHPEREGEYVMEIFSDRLKLWHPQSQTVSFEWKLQAVRRAQYHNRTGKVEIEVGRATETGEGHFYFIGHEVKDMFFKLKESIALLSKAASLRRRGESLPKRPPPSPDALNLLVQQTDDDSSGSNTGGGLEDGVTDEPLPSPPFVDRANHPERPPLTPSYPPLLPTKTTPASPFEKGHNGAFGVMSELLTEVQANYECLMEATKNTETQYETCIPR